MFNFKGKYDILKVIYKKLGKRNFISNVCLIILILLLDDALLSVNYPRFYFVGGEEGLEMTLHGIIEKVNCILDYVKEKIYILISGEGL